MLRKERFILKNIAIIPARSGSKGLKDKNIRELNGKPLLAYTIEAAIRSEQFSCIHVSTDSEEYAKIAIQYGAEVPFLRSKEMASDTASSWDTAREVLYRYKEFGQTFDTIALLQPTSPLRTEEDIKKGYQILKEKGANSVISVCEAEHSPLWCNTLPEDLSMNGFLKRDDNAPRQALSVYYRLNGALYIVKTSILLEKKDIYQSHSFAYQMSQESSVDIDTELDFCIAKVIMDYYTKKDKKNEIQ